MRTITIKTGLVLVSLLGLGWCGIVAASTGKAEKIIEILYIEQRIEHPTVLSNLVSWPEDEGHQGALLGISDNNTTGRFLGQSYRLQAMIFDVDISKAERDERIRQALAEDSRLVILNLPAVDLLDLAQMQEAEDDVLFNAQSMDNALRNSDCQSNLLHTIPSRAMLSDALAQFFTYKKWTQIFLIEGNRPGDKAFADAIRDSIRKFGLKLVGENAWIADADMRRNAAREVPLLTQARKYDVVVVADEDQDFGQYVLYNTWLPRPVAGNAGLSPVAWSRVIEQWGAAQLQSRFIKQTQRDMTSRDYSNWAAVRAIGEAVTRTQSDEPQVLRKYLLSEEFELGGFKGAPLSFRPWNGQMRQPIQLVHANAVVATAPLEGFLHPNSELDTLGIDLGESSCTSFR